MLSRHIAMNRINMPRFLVLCRILTLFCVCGGFPEYVASQSAATTPAASDAHYERDVLRYLWPTLQSAGKAGRIYYEAVCPPNERRNPNRGLPTNGAKDTCGSSA
jgi:hypothetical protein